jgi:hypothetical protein
VEMTESEISQIVDRFNSNVVNVVDIHVSSGTSHDKYLLSDFHVSLMNPIGREILHTLDKWQFRYFPWTLNAGIQNVKLHFKENQNECIKRIENVTNFALENTQNIIRSINLATNYEVCSSYKETSSGKVKRTCCQITKSNSTKFNDGCSEPKSFLHGSSVPWVVISSVMFLFSWFYLMWLLIVLSSRTEFDLKYPEYYKLEESRMSPFFFFFKIFWEGNGHVVSICRRCVLIGVLTYCTYLVFSPAQLNTKVFMLILFFFLGLLPLTSSLYLSEITDSSNLASEMKRNKHSLITFHFNILKYFGHNVNELCQEVDSAEFARVVKILTLAFNVNLWRKIIKKLHGLFTNFNTCVGNTLTNLRILKMFVLYSCYVLEAPIFFLCVCIVFLFLIILAISSFLSRTKSMLDLIQNLEYKIDSCSSLFLSWFHVLFLSFSLGFTLLVMIFVTQSFLLGLCLNLIYFIPYFAFFSVLTFYCCSFWKTMEEKYCVLKRLIYEACQDKLNSVYIPNRDPKREEKVLPVVSKELYDNIREELLPYDTNLFYFVLKIFWSFVFSFGILQLINMLNEFNVTGVVQVVTTASLGIMPQIFNMVGLKTSEERKKAWEEKMELNVKLNVKYMVKKLVGENSERVPTVLIIGKNDGTTSSENIQDPGHVQASSDLNSPDNVEDPELAGVLVIQHDIDTRADQIKLAPTVVREENNDTTDEENVRDYERVEARSDLNPSDSDDGLPIVIIHSPPLMETAMRADDTTADDTTAVDTSAVDTTAGEIANDSTAVETTADDRTSVDTTAGEVHA